MSCVAADTIVNHDGADDDSEGAKDEKSYGKSDLLNGRPVIDNVRVLHHDVLVRYREGVIYVRHYSICVYLCECDSDCVSSSLPDI